MVTVVEPVGLEDRDPAVPPYDSLAETIVLSRLLLYPELIPAHSAEIRPLLVFRQHKLLLTALERAYAATPREEDEAHSSWAARFEICWMYQECERVAPGDGWALADTISPCGPTAAAAEWRRRRWREVRTSAPDLGPTRFDHSWTWWLERLRRVAAARRLVEDAQRIAERAWRGDVDGAVGVANSIRQMQAVVRIDV